MMMIGGHLSMRCNLALQKSLIRFYYTPGSTDIGVVALCSSWQVSLGLALDHYKCSDVEGFCDNLLLTFVGFEESQRVARVISVIIMNGCVVLQEIVISLRVVVAMAPWFFLAMQEKWLNCVNSITLDVS